MESKEKKRLVILGTNLFAPEVADLVEDIGEFDIVAFIENWDRKKAGKTLAGKPIVWVDDAKNLSVDHLAVCSIGDPRRRIFIEQAQSLGFRFATIVHPAARVSSKSRLGPGCVVSAGVIVAAHTQIGSHVILNRGCLIGHHTRIGDFVTVSPGANIAGAIVISDGVYIGMGSIILERLKMGSDSVIAAGALVTKDVPDRVQVRGVPARIYDQLSGK